MTAHETAELEMLREFFERWEVFHACPAKEKPQAAQNLVYQAVQIRRLREPITPQVKHGV